MGQQQAPPALRGNAAYTLLKPVQQHAVQQAGAQPRSCRGCGGPAAWQHGAAMAAEEATRCRASQRTWPAATWCLSAVRPSAASTQACTRLSTCVRSRERQGGGGVVKGAQGQGRARKGNGGSRSEVQHSTARHGTKQRSKARHDTAQRGMSARRGRPPTCTQSTIPSCGPPITKLNKPCSR